MCDQEQTWDEQIREAMHELAAMGLIYDTGERRNGEIVWKLTPGKEAEWRSLGVTVKTLASS